LKEKLIRKTKRGLSGKAIGGLFRRTDDGFQEGRENKEMGQSGNDTGRICRAVLAGTRKVGTGTEKNALHLWGDSRVEALKE